MPLHFLTPTAGRITFAIVLPLVVLLLVERRARRARAVLGLAGPSRLAQLELPLAIGLLGVTLGVAAAQPVLRSERPRLSRTDAEALIAVDISRSMLASSSANGQKRLDRARAIAKQVRTALADTPTGLATFTDRSLPLLLPSSDAEAFSSAVDSTVGIERPPPRSTGVTISSFDAITPIPTTGYYRPPVLRRLLVVVSDAESDTFDIGLLREAFSHAPRIGVVLIRVGGSGETVFGRDGLPETAYIAPPASGEALADFLKATHGRSFGEHQIGAAVRAARADLGTGPRKRLGTTTGKTDLAQWFVLAAVLPLGVVLRRRNL